jgi:hypothetical protein
LTAGIFLFLIRRSTTLERKLNQEQWIITHPPACSAYNIIPDPHRSQIGSNHKVSQQVKRERFVRTEYEERFPKNLAATTERKTARSATEAVMDPKMRDF